MNTNTNQPTGLALLRQPFPAHQISLLPKPTKKREEMDKLPKAKCQVCGGWHATSNVIHLSYVGHAALTDRLLDADPNWTWEPLAMSPDGLPVLDPFGGMWIRLTVCSVTRLGYGHAGEKQGGDAIKETIGDALRNAAMRFGAALDLWHKGDLHGDDEPVKRNGAVADVLATGPQDSLDDETKSYLQFLAVQIPQIVATDGAGEVVKRIEREELDDMQKIFLWSHLDSKTRAAIKKAQGQTAEAK